MTTPDPTRPRVLVVEDEAVARMAAVAMLAEAGYEPVEAESGPAAMRVLEEQAGIRAMLTDIALTSGIDGIMLAACARLRWPGMAIIVTSGKVAPVPGDVPSKAVFFAKPYAEADVLAALDAMLGGSA